MNKKVITFGVFDLFHIGHLNLFKKCKEYGDYLIVGVHNDKLKIKGKDYYFSIEERVTLIKELKLVDEVFIYERVDISLEQKEFDIFIYGEDQNHNYFQNSIKYCINSNKQTIMLNRTKGISSSDIGLFIEQQNKFYNESNYS